MLMIVVSRRCRLLFNTEIEKIERTVTHARCIVSSSFFLYFSVQTQGEKKIVSLYKNIHVFLV